MIYASAVAKFENPIWKFEANTNIKCPNGKDINSFVPILPFVGVI
jgi:hypothetical protein